MTPSLLLIYLPSSNSTAAFDALHLMKETLLLLVCLVENQQTGSINIIYFLLIRYSELIDVSLELIDGSVANLESLKVREY